MNRKLLKLLKELHCLKIVSSIISREYSITDKRSDRIPSSELQDYIIDQSQFSKSSVVMQRVRKELLDFGAIPIKVQGKNYYSCIKLKTSNHEYGKINPVIENKR